MGTSRSGSSRTSTSRATALTGVVNLSAATEVCVQLHVVLLLLCMKCSLAVLAKVDVVSGYQCKPSSVWCYPNEAIASLASGCEDQAVDLFDNFWLPTRLA